MAAKKARPQRAPEIGYLLCPSPFGTVGLAATRDGLALVTFPTTRPAFLRSLRRQGYEPRPEAGSILSRAARQISRYFAGKRVRWSIPLDPLGGTPFQHRVWRAIARIPYGEVRSYEWVARQAGSPGGQQAAGQACGANPIPIVVPCHRVVRKHGALGGFGGGTAMKRALLRLEGRPI